MSSIPIYSLIFFFYCFRHHRDLHSFPTRRSSDLRIYIGAVAEDSSGYPDCRPEFYEAFQRVIDTGTKPETRIEIVTPVIDLRDRKSTRLNSSHANISYAVFCLKKKKKQKYKK